MHQFNKAPLQKEFHNGASLQRNVTTKTGLKKYSIEKIFLCIHTWDDRLTGY